MSLRTRLVLLIAGLVAAASTASGILSYQASSAEAVAVIDALLEAAAIDIVGQSVVADPGTVDEIESEVSAEAVIRLSDAGWILGILDVDGNIRVATSDRILQLDVAVTPGERLSRTLVLGGERFRVRAVGLSDGARAIIGLPTTSVDTALESVRRRQITIAIVVTLVAALTGWAGAGVLSRPLRRLSAAAFEAAHSRALDVDFETTASGEVGQLALGLQGMLSALRESREQQHQLIIDASHELRTPLTTVRMNVDMLRSGKLSESDASTALRRISTEVDELTELSTELAELVATDTYVDDSAPVDMVELVRSVAEQSRARSAREVEVEVVGDEAVVVTGSRRALDRALSNLVNNAVKFSAQDTLIEIRLEPGRVSVTDRGPGIPAGDLERVFERFYRSDEARNLPGSGLGLSIVRQIARNHGGEAFAQNLLDGVMVGFTFR